MTNVYFEKVSSPFYSPKVCGMLIFENSSHASNFSTVCDAPRRCVNCSFWEFILCVRLLKVWTTWNKEWLSQCEPMDALRTLQGIWQDEAPLVAPATAQCRPYSLSDYRERLATFKVPRRVQLREVSVQKFPILQGATPGSSVQNGCHSFFRFIVSSCVLHK